MDHQIICMVKMTSADYRRNGRIGPCQRPQKTTGGHRWMKVPFTLTERRPGVSKYNPLCPGCALRIVESARSESSAKEFFTAVRDGPAETFAQWQSNAQGPARRQQRKFPAGVAHVAGR